MPGAAGMMGRPSGELVQPLDAGAVLQHNLSLLSQGLGTGSPVTVQRIDQLVSDLDETQFLLVKVQLPQSELADSLDVLVRSQAVDRPTDQYAGKALETEMYMLQSDLALRATVVPEQATQEPGETGSGSSQKVFVVNGSADQIRQTLTALVAGREWPSKRLPPNPRPFAYRWFGSTGDANLNPLGGADAKRKAGEAVPEIVSEEKLAKTDAVSPAVPPESRARRSEDAAVPAGCRRGARVWLLRASPRRADARNPRRNPKRVRPTASAGRSELRKRSDLRKWRKTEPSSTFSFGWGPLPYRLHRRTIRRTVDQAAADFVPAAS